MIPTVKQSAFDELPNSDKNNSPPKMCIKHCTTSQQWHSGRKNQKQEASVKKVPGNKFENLCKESLSKTLPPAESNRTGKNIFYSNYLLFLNVLHLLPFLQQKLIITFSSIGFQTMLLKRTIRYNIFLISFIISVSFLNLKLAFNSIDRSPMDTDWVYMRHFEDVMDAFWMPHVRQIYIFTSADHGELLPFLQ